MSKRFSRRLFLSGSVALLGTACIGRGTKSGGGAAGGGGGGSGQPIGGGAIANPPSQDVFGYGRAFDEALAAVGQIEPGELLALHPQAPYLAALGFDPTRARYFDDFQNNQQFALDAAERAAFETNGFVVSERLGAASFAELYYRVFTYDLPVFITADSMLHAWHRSYDAILEELEESYLYHSLREILSGMASSLPAAAKDYGAGVLADSVADADYFVAVARSLLAGKQVNPVAGADESAVKDTLAAVDGLAMQAFPLFGRSREMDYSQFKVRGHYENSVTLQRYFRAMMWLGRIDMRVSGDGEEDYVRQLGSAIVLYDLLRRADKVTQWEQFDRMIQTYVGRTDSMTFGQLGALLAEVKLDSPKDVTDRTVLERVQQKIDSGELGLQAIRSHYVESSPLGSDKAALPRSFTVMGQKFTLDSWATSKIVADDIMWDGGKVQRRMPSALDVAFGVLGNDAAAPLLVDRIGRADGVPFRDGLYYQHNLEAVRRVVDSHPAAAWSENLYMGWIATLRSLSEPTTAEGYPAVARTRAWADRTINTQLASWGQLRHDTILYVKQSYTAGVTCYYPEGYVDPRPVFWKTFAAMAERAVELIAATPYPDGAMRDRHQNQFATFVTYLDRLRSISEKQLACAKLDADEIHVLEDVVQISHGSGFTDYNGWYPTLFYKGPEDCAKYDAIVADVHTDVPAPPLGDPGGVLHQGIGQIDMMMITIDSGGESITYVGPTMSHYELATTGVTRLSDSEWAKRLKAGDAPERPEWTEKYLVPGKNPGAEWYE